MVVLVQPNNNRNGAMGRIGCCNWLRQLVKKPFKSMIVLMQMNIIVQNLDSTDNGFQEVLCGGVTTW